MTDIETGKSKLKIAMLIDGDNAQPSLIGKMLSETGKYGTITIRRIYGNWTARNMGGWKETLHINAFQPVHQFHYTVGKNATDSAMIIDAMDILHSGEVDGFCLVSSDSDYTRLATRIRESGIFVMGIGKRTTPKAFVNACIVFVYTENLDPELRRQEKEKAQARAKARAQTKSKAKAAVSKARTAPSKAKAAASKAKTTTGGRTRRVPEELDYDDEEDDPIRLLKQAFDIAVGIDGWAQLGEFGNQLVKIDPGFDARSFGHSSLSQLIRSYSDIFEMRSEKQRGPTPIYIRLKG